MQLPPLELQAYQKNKLIVLNMAQGEGFLYAALSLLFTTHSLFLSKNYWDSVA
jgi:hypothetical protein